MTDDRTVPGSAKTTVAADPGSDPVLDVEALARELFEKLASAQLDLLRARTAEDPRAADHHCLCLRAAALLLGCLPTHPDSNAYRLKVLAATVLREEDGAEASHAWLMVERALRLDQQRQTGP